MGAPVVSRPASLGLDGLEDREAPRCPSCGGGLESEELRDARGHEVLSCRHCAGLFLDSEGLASLRASRPERRSHAPPAPPEAAPSQAAPPESGDERSIAPRAHLERSVFAPGPARELAALASMFVLAWLFAWSRFGEALSILARIQFHELGHALVAWSTGRRALPLPFGWTSWSFERSHLLVSMQLLFSTLLLVHGVREKKVLAIATAIGLAAIFALGLSTPLEASEPWLVAGGAIGEALLPAVALLAFHAPLPERVRWDFWRWLLALVAIIALASVAQHFLAIARGDAPLPMGSFVSGRRGDGDLERLVNDYGWDMAELRPLFGALGAWSLVLGLAPHPMVLGARALRGRRENASREAGRA